MRSAIYATLGALGVYAIARHLEMSHGISVFAGARDVAGTAAAEGTIGAGQGARFAAAGVDWYTPTLDPRVSTITPAGLLGAMRFLESMRADGPWQRPSDPTEYWSFYLRGDGPTLAQLVEVTAKAGRIGLLRRATVDRMAEGGSFDPDSDLSPEYSDVAPANLPAYLATFGDGRVVVTAPTA